MNEVIAYINDGGILMYPIIAVFAAAVFVNTKAIFTVLTSKINSEVESKKIEGSHSIVSVAITILPMLGLLGTVNGMITLFRDIAHSGSSQISNFASGISIALVTTQTALAFAITLFLLNSLLVSLHNKKQP